MTSLRDDVLAAFQHADVERLQSLLIEHDLPALQASGIAIDQVLTVAAFCEQKALILACLEAGAQVQSVALTNPDQLNKSLYVIAKVAVANNHVEALKECLECGVHPTAGGTARPLAGTAIIKGDIEAFKALMSAGLDVNEDYDYGGDALITSIRANQLDMTTFLLESGAELESDRLMSYCHGPLATAALTDSTEMISLLLAHGVKIPNSLALHEAASGGRIEQMECLLSAGADVNENPKADHVHTWPSDWRLGTPIHYATDTRNLPAVMYLLDHGADPTLLDINGQNIIERSMKDGKAWEDLQQLLRERDIHIT
jgi:ankyrin repeat protein